MQEDRKRVRERDKTSTRGKPKIVKIHQKRPSSIVEVSNNKPLIKENKFAIINTKAKHSFRIVNGFRVLHFKRTSDPARLE